VLTDVFLGKKRKAATPSNKTKLKGVQSKKRKWEAG
jgi:hypothetical protein